MSCIARSAIHRPIAARPERHGCLHAALGARGLVALTLGSRVPTLGFAVLTAIATALRLVREAFLRIKLLIADRELKLAPAFLTTKNLVFHMASGGGWAMQTL